MLTGKKHCGYMDVSENGGTPKSSTFIGFSIISHPFWGTPYFWKHPYFPQVRDDVLGSSSKCRRHDVMTLTCVMYRCVDVLQFSSNSIQLL